MATVKHTLDPKNPPTPSKEDLARFDAIKDGDIDYFDIPEQFYPKPRTSLERNGVFLAVLAFIFMMGQFGGAALNLWGWPTEWF